MNTMDVPTYSREMGGIRSDGQLYEWQRRMEQQPPQEMPQEQAQVHEEPAQETIASPPPQKASERGGLLNLSFFRDLKMDDLLLLAIAFLLFTDSGQERNDLLFLLIGLLLLF